MTHQTSLARPLVSLWIFVTMLMPGAALGNSDLEDLQTSQRTLEAIETQVNALKQENVRLRQELQRLEASVLKGKITQSKALIQFEDASGDFFSFEKAELFLDDQPIATLTPPTDQPPKGVTTLWNQEVPTGKHLLAVKVTYRGNNKKGLKAFSYLKDQRFHQDTEHTFSVEYGRTTVIKLTTLDRGFMKSNFEDRLFIHVQDSLDWGDP